MSEVEIEVTLEPLHVSVNGLKEIGETSGRNTEAGLESDDGRLTCALKLNPEQLGKWRWVVIYHLGQGWKNQVVNLTQGRSLRANDFQVKPVRLARLNIVNQDLDNVKQEWR